MINRLELKTLAKEQIKGNIGILFVIMLIAVGISLVATYIPIIGIFAPFVLASAFELSIMMIYLDMTRGIKPAVSRVFDGFYDLWSVVKLYFLSGLFIFLPSPVGAHTAAHRAKHGALMRSVHRLPRRTGCPTFQPLPPLSVAS